MPETIPLDWSTLVGSVQSYIRGLNFAAKKDMKTNAIEYGLYYVYDWLVISMKEPVLLMITPFKVKTRTERNVSSQQRKLSLLQVDDPPFCMDCSL